MKVAPGGDFILTVDFAKAIIFYVRCALGNVLSLTPCHIPQNPTQTENPIHCQTICKIICKTIFIYAKLFAKLYVKSQLFMFSVFKDSGEAESENLHQTTGETLNI